MLKTDLASFTLPEVLAYTYKQFGPGELRDLLEQVLTLRSSCTYRGFYAPAITELRSIGLSAAADIVEEIDDKAPPRWMLPPPWYMDTASESELKEWRRKMDQQRREHEARD